MSVDQAFREMIRKEIESQLRPLQNAVSRLQEGASNLGELRALAERLNPLSALLGGAVRRGPGRPPGSVNSARAGARGNKKVRGAGRRRVRAEAGANDRPCALVGCKNKARSKGYCAAHYQKLRNLSRTGRLPADWKEYAEPNSVSDIVLPRGRAAAKALRAAREKKS